MAFKKCDFPGCEEIGTCRAPKDRNLKEYYNFCKKHAAEYNKNWNYYAGMSIEDIIKDDEKSRETKSIFGGTKRKFDTDLEFLKSLLGQKTGNYVKTKAPTPPQNKALKTLGLKWPITIDAIQKEYRKLAKKHHPDLGGDTKKFAEINAAFDVLKKCLKK